MTTNLAAESGIRQLHARYADAVFRKDFCTFADCFTEDAAWHVGGHALHGRAAIAAFVAERVQDSHFVLMQFGTPLLAFGPGTASGRTRVVEHNAYRNAPPRMNIATYFERFVEQNGIWRRAWALFQLHYMGPPDFSGTFLDTPDPGPPPALPEP